LHKLGRHGEALDAYDALHRLDPDPLAIWKANMPDVMLAAGQVGSARFYMANPDNARLFTHGSTTLVRVQSAVAASMLPRGQAPPPPRTPTSPPSTHLLPKTCSDCLSQHWMAAQALVDYIKVFASKPATDGWPHRCWFFGPKNPEDPPGRAAVQFVMENTEAARMLTGLAPLPTGRMPGLITVPPADLGHCTTQMAACWVHGAAPVWARFPGAVDWLRRVYNTATLIRAIKGLSVQPGEAPVPMVKSAAAAAIRAGEIFPHAMLTGDKTLLHLAACSESTSSRVVGALLKAGAPALPIMDELAPSPLESSAYYSGQSSSIETLSILLRRTPRPPAGTPDGVRWSAAAMAANQGNAEALTMILEDLRNSRLKAAWSCFCR